MKASEINPQYGDYEVDRLDPMHPANAMPALQGQVESLKQELAKRDARIEEQAKLIDQLGKALEKTLAALVSYKRYIPEPYKQNPIYIMGSHEAEKEAIQALALIRK